MTTHNFLDIVLRAHVPALPYTKFYQSVACTHALHTFPSVQTKHQQTEGATNVHFTRDTEKNKWVP